MHKLPKITILATGGTIAGQGDNETTARYEAGQLTVEMLIKTIPELTKIANIEGIQIANISSKNATDELWLALANIINQKCDDTDGFVITHGTDTLEETAYFLNLVVKCNKPVVIVGSMRPATAKSADGPLNLYNAVITAMDKKSKDYGVLVTMNDQIFSARDVSKTSTTAIQSFSSQNHSSMGSIYDNKVQFEYFPLKPSTINTPFNISAVKNLPKVGIIYHYANTPTEPLIALLDAGFEGIINAGVGNGNVNDANLRLLIEAAKKGIAIVRSSRVKTGYVIRDAQIADSEYGFIASNDLNPQKARILLQLALTKTKEIKQIQQFFDRF